LKVLVTGSSGFLGGHLIEQLLPKRHEVVGMVRKGSDTDLLQDLGVEMRKGDLTDPASLLEVTKGVDCVIHLAAYYTFSGKKERYEEINVQGTKNMLDAMLKNGVKRIIYCSSTEAIGPTPNGIANESSSCHPYYEYGRSKLRAENLIRECERSGIEHTIIRPSGIYGPRNLDDVSYWFITTFANSIASRMIIGDGKKVLQFVHLDDAVQGFLLALGKWDIAKNQTYIITDSRAYTYEEIYGIMANIFNKPAPRRHVPVWLAKIMVAPVQGMNYLRGEPNFVWRISSMNTFKVDRNYSIEKAGRELGYAPRHTLPEGLRETAKWYQQKGYIKGASAQLESI